MKPATTLSDALTDKTLFGGTFKGPSFWTWRTVAKLIDGIPLTEPREIDLYKQCTGRTKLPDGPVRRLIVLVGRRGGKDRFMSAVAVWRAALSQNWNKCISAGEQAVVLLLGADRKQRRLSSATTSSSSAARRWTNSVSACSTPIALRTAQQDHRDLRAQDQQALSRQAANRDRRHGPAQPGDSQPLWQWLRQAWLPT
jgi:hypothetical protein